MKIHELEIEQFGVFRNRQLQLDSGLQILYGANETGKTTLLQLVRQLLFGFPHRNPYSLPEHSGPLCAKASLEMADGQRLWFRRRKGRPDQVSGEIEDKGKITEVNEGLLTAVLGKATPELYNNVFGFSLDELANGTQSLREANLTEALYGGGIGNLANVQRVRAHLESETKRLFNTRSPKSEIRRLLQQIEDDEKLWRDAQISPTQHRQMLAKQIEADQAVDVLKKQLQETREAAKRRRLLVDAKQEHSQWLKLVEELGRLPQTQVDEDAARRFEWLKKQLASQQKSVAELQTKLQDCQTQLSALPPDGAFSAQAESIQNLFQQVARLQGYREDLPRRRQEAESIRESLLTQLQQINPDWNNDSLPQLQAGEEQRSAVQKLSESRVKLDRKRAQSKSQLKELRLQAERWRDLAEPNQERDGEQLAAAIQLADRLAEFQVDRRQLQEGVLPDLLELEEQRGKLKSMLQKQLKWDGDPLVNLPTTEAIEAGRQSLDSLQAKRSALAEALTAADAQRLRAAKKLEEFQTKADPPSRDRLCKAREDRDRILRALRLLANAKNDPDAIGQAQSAWDALGLPPQQSPWEAAQDALVQADREADALLEEADLVSRSLRLSRDLADAEAQVAEQQQLQANLQQDQEKAASDWRQTWESTGLEPLPPGEMADWRRRYLEWVELNEKAIRLDAQKKQLLARTDAYEADWKSLITGMSANLNSQDAANSDSHSDETSALPQSVAQGIQWLQQQREKAQQADVAKRELPEIQKRMEEASAGLQSAEDELESWAVQWSKLLAQLDFPPHWEPQLVQRVYQSLAEASSRLRNCESLEKRARDMQRELDASQLDVDAVLAKLNISLPNMPVDSVISQLYAKLEDERSGQQQKRILTSQRDETSRRLQQAQAEAQESQREIQQLSGQLNTSDESELAARLKAAEKRKKLERSTEQARERLAAFAKQAQLEDLDEFLDLLHGSREEDLLEDQAEDALKLKELEEEVEQAQRRAGAAVAAIDGLVDATEATLRARKLASDQAQLAHLVDRWAPLAIARQLLSISMERFERDNQPALLQDTARLFSSLTEGRYTNVIRRLEENQSLTVVTASGDFKTPDQLSTGAREQLYLAIRLAYVAQYCQRSEPLPMVMDDILVNFDDERAASALRVLHEFAADKQILFLTCHRRTIELATPLGIAVTELQQNRVPPPLSRKRVSAKKQIEASAVDSTSLGAETAEEPKVVAKRVRAVSPNSSTEANSSAAVPAEKKAKVEDAVEGKSAANAGEVQRVLFPRQ